MNTLTATPSLATAAEVMTTAVISVGPDRTIREVATLLLDARISAVPVVDGDGAVLGIVSEGDLLGRSAGDRLSGQEWWLAILSAPGQMEAAVTEAATARLVRDVMHTPVVTADAAAPVRDVAELLRVNAIKRVPVMRDGRMVGIVSRADLLRAMEAIPEAAPSWSARGFADMVGGFFTGTAAGVAPHAAAPSPAALAAATVAAEVATPLTAEAFRGLVGESIQGHLDEKRAIAHAADLARIKQVKTLMHEHLGAEMWDKLMTHARVAAAHGGKEIELIRFPSDLCTDGGRMINNADPAWAQTLQGEAAEVQARWERDLKPAGFGLVARVTDYPQGMPGTIAMVLVWEN